MTPSSYLRDILDREAVDDGSGALLQQFESQIERICAEWAGRHLLEIYPAGGYARGTANRSGVQIDFVASLSPQTPYTARQIYDSLFEALHRMGLLPTRRSVSISIELNNTLVDIIPAKRESLNSDFHELHTARRGLSAKTNLMQHVLDAIESNRHEEVRIIKLWRDQQGLDFPSFYLELSVLAALRRRPLGELAENVWAVLGYYETLFPARGLLDPANANNVVSDELVGAEKLAVRDAAREARSGRPWVEIVG